MKKFMQTFARQVLFSHFDALSLSNKQRSMIIKDISRRLGSLLSHWGDLSFRRTILFLGIEEAIFWEPISISLEIRSLVVVIIRNSLIEDLGASNPYTKELKSRKRELSDNEIVDITSESARFLDQVNLNQLRLYPDGDIFGDLHRRFPNAWQAISHLSQTSDHEIGWEKEYDNNEMIKDYDLNRMDQDNIVIASGLDPRFDSYLLEIMQKIKHGEISLFFSPSFKFITRNPEKLLFIIEYVIRYGGSIMTLNYLISQDKLARRDPLIRPPHNTSEIEDKIKNLFGLTNDHADLMRSVLCEE